MRLLFVHDHYFACLNGVVYSDTFPYVVWQRYLRHFEEITVLGRCASEEAVLGRQQVSSGPGVSFHFGENISTAVALLTTRPREKRRVEALVADHGAVIARLPSEYGLMAAEIARRMRKPYLLEVVGCGWDALWHYGGLRARAYAPLLALRMKRAVWSANFVSYVSQRFLQRRYPVRPHGTAAAISNVEVGRFEEAVLARRLERIRQSRGRVRLGLIGSLKTRYKGVQTAIEALGRIRSLGFELHVLGRGDPGPYQRMAEAVGVADSVFFEGTLPSGDPVLRWLDDIDVYLQPSLTEGVPRALIEAMSRGCICFASRVGGIPELLDDDCTFPPADADAIAELLERRSSDSAWCELQALRNFQEAKKYTKEVLDARRAELLGKFERAARSRQPVSSVRDGGFQRSR